MWQSIISFFTALFLGSTPQPEYTVNPTPVPEVYYTVAQVAVADGMKLEFHETGYFNASEAASIEKNQTIYGIKLSFTNLAASSALLDMNYIKVYADGVLCERYTHLGSMIETVWLESKAVSSGWLYYIVPAQVQNIAFSYQNDSSVYMEILFKLQ